MRIDVARAASALELLGWDTAFAASFEPYADQGLEPGRVAVQHRGACIVRTEGAETSAGISGKLRHGATGPADFPAVGDWVALADGVVQAVLPRRTAFVRRAPGPGGRIEEQVLAANIDVAFLISALTRDLNPRRIERYLTTAWASGAEPVVVLTKSDLCLDLPGALAEVEAVAFGVPVHHVSALTGDGVDELKGYLAGHRTAALLGSSGVGKSTLTNRLIGRDLLQTQDTRRDGKGRHTTSHRELILVPGGGIVIDTPGLRELQLWDAPSGLESAFEDIGVLAEGCRFRDCRHGLEPGCAVGAALLAGTLDSERLAGYRKLERELAFLERKEAVRERRQGRG